MCSDKKLCYFFNRSNFLHKCYKKLHIIKNDNGKFLVYICIICTILGKNWFQKMQTSFADTVSDIKIKM